MSENLKRDMEKPDFRGALASSDIRAMRGESDRGAVLIAAAYIDEMLEELLSANFVDDTRLINRLLTYPGACSTLAARCDLAYCLGYFGPKMHADIRAVIKIRNQFAHSRKEVNFGNPEIAEICQQLHLVQELRASVSHFNVSTRNIFLMAAGSLIRGLEGLIRTSVHRSSGPELSEIPKSDPNWMGY